MNLIHFSISLVFAFLIKNEGCPLAEDVPQHYCGSRLSSALRAVCKNNGYVSFFSAGHRNSSMKGVIQECCHNPCKRSVLKLYCQGQDAKSNEHISKKTSGDLQPDGRSQKRKRPRRCRCTRKNKTGRQTRGKKSSPKKMSLTTTPSSDMTTHFYDDPEVEYVDDWNGPMLSLHTYRMG